MMNNLNGLMAKKMQEIEAKRTTAPVKINNKWEEAVEFCRYCGFPQDRGMVIFILKLCKIYGAGKVYGLKSWIKDANYDQQRAKGLLVWKLKGGKYK